MTLYSPRNFYTPHHFSYPKYTRVVRTHFDRSVSRVLYHHFIYGHSYKHSTLFGNAVLICVWLENLIFSSIIALRWPNTILLCQTIALEVHFQTAILLATELSSIFLVGREYLPTHDWYRPINDVLFLTTFGITWLYWLPKYLLLTFTRIMMGLMTPGDVVVLWMFV